MNIFGLKKGNAGEGKRDKEIEKKKENIT